MKKKILITILFTGLICLPVGTYIGAKFFAKGDIRPLINMIAVNESFELSRSAIILEALNNGKIQEVKFMLYSDIKNELNLNKKYAIDDNILLDSTKETIETERKKAKAILDQYPYPKPLK